MAMEPPAHQINTHPAAFLLPPFSEAEKTVKRKGVFGERVLGIVQVADSRRYLTNRTVHLLTWSTFTTTQQTNPETNGSQGQQREGSLSPAEEPADPAGGLRGREISPQGPPGGSLPQPPNASHCSDWISRGIYSLHLNLITLGPSWTHVLPWCFPQRREVAFIHSWSINSTNIDQGPTMQQEALRSEAGLSADNTRLVRRLPEYTQGQCCLCWASPQIPQELKP